MGKCYCSLNRGDYLSDPQVGCESCRKNVSVVVKVPFTDSSGARRVAENEVYCLTSLAELAMKNHPYFQKTNLSLQFTNQSPIGSEEGKEED